MNVVRLAPLAAHGLPEPCVAIGNFDGVHRGHRALVRATVEAARAMGGAAAVLTFEPHPARVVAPDRAPAALMTAGQKERALASLGVDHLVVLPFTRETASWPAAVFAERVIAGALQARLVVVGANFRFGHGREGDSSGLAALGQRMGFEVRVVPPVMEGGEPISSSRIRAALGLGDVATARLLIGRAFEVEGVVARGDGRGRGLGFPTANLEVANEMRPAEGVYACRVTGGPLAGPADAVVNVGRRPTFGGGKVTVEAHLLDRDLDLYGSRLSVAFVDRLREERAFAGPAALVEQLRADVAAARARLSAGGEGDAV